MSVSYRGVQWNRHKKTYDLCVAGGVALLAGAYSGIALDSSGVPSAPILVMRALGVCGLVMLHVILCIGPAARLDRRFAPLLYNRRHLGVMMFCVGLLHAAIAVGYYGAFGVRFPLAALADPPGRGVPFEALGLAGLLVLLVMAATSHDFWLKNLTPRVWKGLHMLVYGAYAALVLHVALGAMQSERSPTFPILIAAGVVLVGSLHVAAGVKQARRDRPAAGPASEAGIDGCDWLDAGDPLTIPEGRARVVRTASGERIAVFRHEGSVSAVSNVCVHQGGPLGEGKIVGGCITCPWHGYQYRPGDGCSPPPYTEKIPTYRVRVDRGRVLVDANALPPGTPVTPASIGASAIHAGAPPISASSAAAAARGDSA